MTLDGSLRDNDFRRRWERVVEDELRIPEDRRLRLVALGDTHLNCGERLPAEATAAIAAAEPDALLHTGDIAWLPGLAPLAEIAPIYPVRGNRDILDWRKLPAMRRFRIGRRSLLLFHGYGSSLADYLRMRRMAARRSLALRTMNLGFPSEAASDDFLVYGHTYPSGAGGGGRWPRYRESGRVDGKGERLRAWRSEIRRDRAWRGRRRDGRNPRQIR